MTGPAAPTPLGRPEVAAGPPLGDLLEALGLAAAVLDGRGALLAWTQGFAEALSLAPERCRPGRAWTEVLPEVGWAPVEGVGRPAWTASLLRADGTTVILRRQELACGSSVVTCARPGDGESARVLEEHLRRAARLEAMGQLAQGIAHDFNNLLTVIQGRVELLLHRLGDDPRVRPHLLLLCETVERGAALTRQLLAFGRGDRMAPRVVDAGRALVRLGALLQRLVGEQVELVVRPPPGPAPVRVDPGQFEQVVINLAVNARDAMPGGGRLMLGAREVVLDRAFADAHPGARPGSYVALSVQDTGVGMDAATRARLFEPFFTTKPAGQGTGLGLTVVQSIVKAHGGYIQVESAPGAGTCFTVYWPRCAEPPAPVEAEEPETALRPGSETVLVVEDEHSVRDLVREMLEPLGYQVLTAGSPGEALLLGDRHPGPIHVLLTDVVMPEMGGPELARRLAARRPTLRVVYMSGYGEEVATAGSTWLPKPFSAGGLARALRAVLDGQGAG